MSKPEVLLPDTDWEKISNFRERVVHTTVQSELAHEALENFTSDLSALSLRKIDRLSQRFDRAERVRIIAAKKYLALCRKLGVTP